jgi:uncharacterized protein
MMRGLASNDRIALIDALRGFSLLGIVVVHFMEQYLGFMPPPEHQEYSRHGPVDQVLEVLGFLLIRGKGFALFSFMFGLSFALQMQRAERRNPERDFRGRFAWRLAILFGIGVAHSFFYAGDILMIYAVLGVPLMAFYRVRDRWLWILALILIAGAPRVVMHFSLPRPTTADLQARQADAEEQAVRHWAVLTEGSLAEVAWENSRETLGSRLEFQFGGFARGYQTLGHFLLGLWTGRRRVFEQVERHLPRIRRVFRWTLILTVALPVIAGALALLAAASGGEQGSGGDEPVVMPDFTSWPMIAGLGAYDVWNLIMTALYITLFVRLFCRPGWGERLRHFVPVGRMALTAYVVQTVAGSLLFLGFGLGLLGTVGNAVTIPVAAALFAVQMVGCRWWLHRYHYGPLEWLWRSLTLLHPQRFIRSRA